MATICSAPGARLHGHAHHGREHGATPAGVAVRNVAYPVIRSPARVYHLTPMSRMRWAPFWSDPEGKTDTAELESSEPAPTSQPQPGGGWISGPCTNPARPNAPLPQFNPSVLVLAVQRLLGERGITAIVDLGNADTAVTAASELLRALGVAPAGRNR